MFDSGRKTSGSSALRRGRRAPLRHVRTQCVCGERLGEEVALPLATADGLEALELLAVLDALRGDTESHHLTDVDYGGDERGVSVVSSTEGRHECAVDLHDVNGEAVEIAE